MTSAWCPHCKDPRAGDGQHWIPGHGYTCPGPVDSHPIVERITEHSALIARLTNLIDNLSARVEHLEQHDTCPTSPMWLREVEPDRWNITDHD